MPVSLEVADRLCLAVLEVASAAGALVSVAVVDAGGHLVAFRRMDGAEIAGPIIAPDKAFTAVANRISTAELRELAQPGGDLFGYQSAAGGRFIAFGGGMPLFDGTHAVGAIGVSGATSAQDHAFAEAAVAVWTELVAAG